MAGDPAGDARLVDTAEKRFDYCPYAIRVLDELTLKANELDAFIVHTGDLIDYVNDGNLAVAGKMADLAPGGVFAAGNHEYCKMVGDGKVEDEAYKAESRARVQSAYPGNLLFASRVVNGVNFVSFDNIYYYVPAGVPEMFEAEAARGLPVVLCCHVPFYTPEIYEAVTRGDVTRAPYLCGTPDEIVDQVKDQYRRRQQRAPPAARRRQNA